MTLLERAFYRNVNNPLLGVSNEWFAATFIHILIIYKSHWASFIKFCYAIEVTI